jgi:hypothetical protein
MIELAVNGEKDSLGEIEIGGGSCKRERINVVGVDHKTSLLYILQPISL